MAQNYNGDLTGITPHETANITEPVGTDVRNAASVQTPLRRLTNLLQYLMQKAGLLDQANTWLAPQSISSGNLLLTSSVSQAVYKQGTGGLYLGTDTGNSADVVIQRNGTTVAAFGSAALDNASRRIINVADPAAAQDADTRAARDSAIGAHNATMTAHGATSLPTGGTIAWREAGGRSQFADPVGAQDADTLAARNAAISTHNGDAAAHAAAFTSQLATHNADSGAHAAAIAAALDNGGSYLNGSNWSILPSSQFRRVGTSLIVANLRLGALNASASYASVATLAAGSRPPGDMVRVPCVVYEAASGNPYSALASISSSTGVVSVTHYNPGSGMTNSLRTIAANDTVELIVTFVL